MLSIIAVITSYSIHYTKLYELPFGRMIALVAERGRLMDEACARSGGSAMSAVLGLEAPAIEAALKGAGVADAWIANYNAPTQSVLSGTVV